VVHKKVNVYQESYDIIKFMKVKRIISKGFVFSFKYLFYFGIICTFLGALFALGLYYHFSSNLPEIITVQDYKPLIITEVYSNENIKIGEFAKEKRKRM